MMVSLNLVLTILRGELHIYDFEFLKIIKTDALEKIA